MSKNLQLIIGFTIISLFTSSIALIEVCTFILIGYIFFKLIQLKDNPMPIGTIALSLAGFQWLISPIISYHSTFPQYEMSVDELTYLRITLIGYVAFVLGVFISKNSISYFYYLKLDNLILKSRTLLPYSKILIIIGSIVMLLPSLGSAFAFIKELAGSLFIVGIIMLMYYKPSKSINITVVSIIFLLVISVYNGMFHNLLVWGLFLLLNLFYIKKYSLIKKALYCFILILILTSLQSVKSTYRMASSNSSFTDKITIFSELLYTSITGNIIEETDINSRFNQGWIISRIYSNIPNNVNFQNGRTIKEGILATLIPRFVNPNKKDSGISSIKDFTLFTGYTLNSRTSMGLSIWGEAYGNFGVLGGAVFMFIWGFIISKLLNWIIILFKQNGYWFFFIPIICFDIVKAEINFLSVLNWTVKSMIFCWIIILILNKHYPNQNDKYILQEKA